MIDMEYSSNLSAEGFPQTVCLHLPTHSITATPRTVYYTQNASIVTGFLKFNLLPQFSLGACAGDTHAQLNTQPNRPTVPPNYSTVGHDRRQRNHQLAATTNHPNAFPDNCCVRLSSYGGFRVSAGDFTVPCTSKQPGTLGDASWQ
jgi:hypothetical protein